MARISNRQTALKPQDFLVAVKVALGGKRAFSYASVAADLSLSASEVHASVKRARLARLLSASESNTLIANRAAIREFAVHGVKYAFPAELGNVTRGIATASGGPSFRDVLVEADGQAPVWPYPSGTTRGPALYPLYPSVPSAVEKDAALYDVLTLVDALRIGAARERELAAVLIGERLT